MPRSIIQRLAALEQYREIIRERITTADAEEKAIAETLGIPVDRLPRVAEGLLTLHKKSKRKPQTSSPGMQARASAGRRDVAAGKRPAIRQAIIDVMGTDVLDATAVTERLKERGWLPNSKDPKRYVGYVMSSLPGTFLRIKGKRGFYRVQRATAPKSKKKAAPKKAKSR
jgi:hypothetical protein